VMRECDPEHAPAGHPYVSDYLTQELSRHGKRVRHDSSTMGAPRAAAAVSRAGG
jgi:hypothetical protein